MLRAATLLACAASAAEISHCEWDYGALQVAWAAAEDADYYEVQVALEAGGPIFAVHSTEQAAATLDFVSDYQTVWLKVRAHRSGMPSLGPGTWSEPGKEVQCQPGFAGASRPSPIAVRSPAAETRFLEVMRQSEFTYDVDYLANHNSGDIGGDVTFIVQSSHDEDQPGFLNVTFRKSVFTLYCVETLVVSVDDTVTTDGDDSFADYLSCNDNHNATDPLCICDNYIDRSFSKKDDQMKYCHTKTGGTCQGGFSHDCVCDCSDASLAASAAYTGMMPVYHSQPELLGHWYSHPKATECAEAEAVGATRADGSRCTWKRQPHARVVRGGDALDFGWNFTQSSSHNTIDVAQVRQNAALMRELFDAKGFQKWTCSEPSAPAMIV